MKRYVNIIVNKITGNTGKEFDEEKAKKGFIEAHEKDVDGNIKTDKTGEPVVDTDQFLDLLDNFWLKAKTAGMEEERAKGESSDNLYNIAAMAMLASVLNTLILAAVAYKMFG